METAIGIFGRSSEMRKAGVATNNENLLLTAIKDLEEDHDFGAYVACLECSNPSPGID